MQMLRENKLRDKTKQKGPNNRAINPDVTNFDGDIEFSERALRLCSETSKSTH